jgi:acyl-CoA oxidase
MFELAIRYLGDDEQVKQWLPLITKCKIIGNYSQTELGHGSNVRVSCDVEIECC